MAAYFLVRAGGQQGCAFIPTPFQRGACRSLGGGQRYPAERSRRSVQFGAEADLIIVQGCGPLARDVHLKPVLLAQDEHLPNGERLNPRGWDPESNRDR